MFQRNIVRLFIIQGFLLSGIMSAQEKVKIIDPTMNRLFIMPTGNILPKGTLSISFTDVTYFNIGYTPTDFLQANFSGLIPIPDLVENKPVNKNLSLAVKSEILRDIWLIQGVSVGGEVIYSGIKKEEPFYFDEQLNKTISYYDGIYDEIFQINYYRNTPLLGSINLAFSMGSNEFQIHANLVKLFFPNETPRFSYGWDFDYYEEYHLPSLPFLSYIQFGFEYDISWLQTKRGMKLISEIFYNKLNPDYNMLMSGFRFYGSTVSVDIAIAYVGNEYGRGYEGILPIISFNLFY